MVGFKMFSPFNRFNRKAIDKNFFSFKQYLHCELFLDLVNLFPKDIKILIKPDLVQETA